MKRMIASVLVIAFLATGCTGSFNLTRKVNNFHRSQTDKWADELCFLLVALTPIYGLATFADAIIFNSIEFWTGDNPVTMANAGPRVIQNGKDKMVMTYDAKTDKVHLTSVDGKKSQTIVFERSKDMVVAKNEKGDVLYTSAKNEKGDVSVYDNNNNLVKNYAPGQIAMAKETQSAN